MRASLDWAFGPEGAPEIGVALTVAALLLWVQMSLWSSAANALNALAKLTATAILRKGNVCSSLQPWAISDIRIGRAREAGDLWATTLELADKLDDKDHRLRALWGLCIDQFNNGDFLKALEFARRFAEETKPPDRWRGSTQ